MTEASEITAKIERMCPGSDEWFVPCPFECGWAEKGKQPQVLISQLIAHLNARHMGGNA